MVIYNAGFDLGILAWDCHRCELPGLELRAECAMLQYAAWVGDWNDYHGNFKWKPLNGGHRALGDCFACLYRIKSMATEELSHE